MSDIAAKPAGAELGLESKMRHIGVSLLPLALFVGGALGIEQLSAMRAVKPAMKAQTIVQPASSEKAGAAQVPGPSTAAQVRQSRPAATSMPGGVPSLRDERSLLELAAKASPERAPVTATPARAGIEVVVAKPAPAPTPAAVEPVERPLTYAERPPVPAISLNDRVIETTIGASVPNLLDFPVSKDSVPGLYAIVRGIPQNARLSHGIPIGETSWLVDGAEVGNTALELSAGTSGDVPLELLLMTGDSRLLARQVVILAVRASAGTSTPPVPAAPVQTASVPSPMKLAIARDTALIPGRGSLLRVELEPRSAVPAGAYVVLRGLPVDTALSRGIAMGPDAWLVGLNELAGLEVRLPQRANGAIELDARLLSADGLLLASHAGRLDVAAVTAVPSRAAQPAPVAAPVAAPLAAPASPVIARSVANPTTMPLPPQPQNVALARGRRMLELGNIASARPLLERAATEGSGEAAALLAASYDQDWLDTTGAVGMRGRQDNAARWYAEARRLGTADPERVATLPKAQPKQR